MDKESEVDTTTFSAEPDLGRGMDAVAHQHCAKQRENAEVS